MSYKEKVNLGLYTYQNNSFVLQAIIDDYQEISFTDSIYEAGDFTITINYNIPNALKFERGMWIQFGNDVYRFGEIIKISDSIGEDGKGSQIRTITGKDARYILKRRIIKNLNNVENWQMTAKGELVIRNLINDQCGSNAEEKRKLPITNIIPESGAGLTYTCSEQFSNLYDVIVQIAVQSETCWRIKFENNELVLICYEATDRSRTVQFSTDFDSLANGEYTDSAESYCNTVYVGGKGNGADRDIYEAEAFIDGSFLQLKDDERYVLLIDNVDNKLVISGHRGQGLERYEAWNNQSSLTNVDEYMNVAENILKEYAQTIDIAGQGLIKSPYIYNEQYFVGDIITLAFSGKKAVTQILSVTECWSGRGEYEISFTFGKPKNTLADQLQLILKQIQSASAKQESNTTSSVRYYEIPTETEMPKSDIIYNTIGFTGDVGNGATFKLYWESNKTGAKTYHVYLKQLAGEGKLTLTTGVAGATNLLLDSGTYVTIIYVDSDGNVLKTI